VISVKSYYNTVIQSIYDTNKHSVYLLQYHLILVVKYRRKVIDNEICNRLKEIFEYIGTKDQYKLKIIEFNHDNDHLHILFKAEPKSELKKFINAYKSASSRLIKKRVPRDKKETLARGFLEQKLFFNYNWWSHLRGLKELCRKSRK